MPPSHYHGGTMKPVALPILLICALSACSKSGTTAPDTDATPEPAVETAPSAPTSSKPNPEAPADQFVIMDTALDCLGIYANLAPAEGKERAVIEYARKEDPTFRSLEGFARADKIKAMDGAYEAAVAPMKGKRLFTFTRQTRDDYREYNMETKAFFDSTHMTWASDDPMMGSSEPPGLTFTDGDGHCILQLVNTENWKAQFKVEDEAQARAADAARQAGNGHVKFYLQAVQADGGELDWPRVRAEIVRVELVDKAGNMLARAQPSL